MSCRRRQAHREGQQAEAGAIKRTGRMKQSRLTKRQKESQKLNRKRAVRQWWKITSRRCLLMSFIFLFTFFSIGGWWLCHTHKAAALADNISHKFWGVTAGMGFSLKSIYLQGRVATPVAEITQAMNVTSGTPILAISLPEMKQALEAIPHIKHVQIARILPNQLDVQIEERAPVAIWQHNSSLHLVDDDGVVMEYADPAQYKNLLLIVGDDAPSHTHDLFVMLAEEPQLYKNVAAVLRIGERRWNVRFKNGIELKLPEKDATVAWKNFADMENKNHILERAIQSVDMRLSDRIFIKYAPSEMPPATKNSGRET
ncbi:MAG TPA: cell division protein FtsQ/DivIB [Rickettsiales bacterium]|nr:cell division protein FtsQ/DivIB [Rickettsiales bacterium]